MATTIQLARVPPGSETAAHVAQAQRLLQQAFASPLEDVFALFEQLIPVSHRFEVVLELYLDRSDQFQRHLEQLRKCLPIQSGCSEDVEMLSHQNTIQKMIGLDLLPLWLGHYPYARDRIGKDLQPFRLEIESSLKVLEELEAPSGTITLLTGLLDSNGELLDTLKARSVYQLVAGNLPEAHSVPQGHSKEWKDAARLLASAAERTLTMSELRRTVQAAGQLPPALLPNASTTFAIAVKSPQLAGELYKRIGVLSAPAQIGTSRHKLQSSLADHLRSLVSLPPFSLRSYDLWTRLLTNDELVQLGHEEISTGEVIVPMAQLARIEALEPWLDRALQNIERNDFSSDVLARNVTLLCTFLNSLLASGILLAPDPLSPSSALPPPDNDALLSRRIRASEDHRQSMITLLKPFALSHSRYKEAAGLYKRLVQLDEAHV